MIQKEIKEKKRYCGLDERNDEEEEEEEKTDEEEKGKGHHGQVRLSNQHLCDGEAAR